MVRSLFGIAFRCDQRRRQCTSKSARFVSALTICAHRWASTAARDTRIADAVRASMRTGVKTHTRNGNCLCLRRLVPFQRHIPFRRRIVEGMFAATSLVLLWMIILAIDARAGVQLAGAVTRGVSTNGGAVMQVSNSVGHVTRSVWELSYTYGPLMTFGCIAIVLVIVMTRSTR